jgi:hypothetical protein
LLDEDDLEDEHDADEVAAANRLANANSDFKDFTEAEVASLNRCLRLLKQGGNRDPKLEAILGYLLGTRPDVERRWKTFGYRSHSIMKSTHAN